MVTVFVLLVLGFRQEVGQSGLLFNMERFMLIGKELGLSGIELRNFCENERKLDLETKSLERDERIKLRELEKQKSRIESEEKCASALRQSEETKLVRQSELEKELRQSELDKELRQSEIAKAKIEAELSKTKLDFDFQLNQSKYNLEAQDRIRIHEITLKNLELQASTGTRTTVVSEEGDMRQNRSEEINFAKLVPFQKLGENEAMDMFLTRFERHADLCKLTGAYKAMSLANCLVDKAKNIYDLLDTQNAEDFEYIKTALLSAFQIDADSSKTKFESARLYPLETIPQFLVRILWKSEVFGRGRRISQIVIKLMKG